MGSSDSDSGSDADSRGSDQELSLNGRRLGRLPLLAEDIELDDAGATVVFVFSKAKQAGGIVNADAPKEEAESEAGKIFFMNQSPQAFQLYQVDLHTFVELETMLKVTEGEYQDLVRKDFLRVLQAGGLQVQSSNSIDGDEIFLKVNLPKEEKRLSQLAKFYRYRKAVKSDVLNDGLKAQAEAHQAHKHVPFREDDLINGEGLTVPLFVEYSEEFTDEMEPFTQMDEIRLIMRWVSDRVNLDELQSQNVLVKVFPGANFEQIRHLAKSWANLSWLYVAASKEDALAARDYYGERIAFFFLWFGTYKVQLVYLAIASFGVKFIVWLSKGSSVEHWVPNLFVVYLTLWVVIFNETFKRKCSRYAQHWGMKDWAQTEAEVLATYEENMDWRGDVRKTMAPIFTMLYVLLFASAIMAITLKNAEMRMHGDMRLADWQPYIVTILMYVCSGSWSYLAAIVVGWENHRTEPRRDDSLAWTLASVKLFVALFPFITLAFLEAYVTQNCQPTLALAAVSTYRFSGWPAGTESITAGVSAVNATELEPYATTALAFLDSYKRETEDGAQCVSGCFPTQCHPYNFTDRHHHMIHTKWACVNSCQENIEYQLVTYYGAQVVAQIVFLLIPIFLTKYAIVSEIIKAADARQGRARTAIFRYFAILRSFFGSRISEEGGGGGDYSLMQYQAKCPAYAYGSWGGSFVEDFLGVAIGYALLACFSQLKPSMVVVGVCCHFVMYRILAYRMLNVTCRPWPLGADGIGIWQSIMDTIALLAVTCNVALSTFFMPPIKDWNTEYKFLFFILAEKALLSLRTLVGALVKDEPDEVTRIYDNLGDAASTVLPHRDLDESPKKHDINLGWLGL